MKAIRVAAAVIVRGGRVLACRRGHGMDGWEFPGGKLEPGESAERACRREIAEELGIGLGQVTPLMTVEHDYPDFHLSMAVFVCPVDGSVEPHRTEHRELRWLDRGEMSSLGWLPADRPVAARLSRDWEDLVGPGAL